AACWETKMNPADAKTIWTLVEPEKFSATGKVKLRREADGSLTSSEGKSPSDYAITVHSALTNITGVMVETLPDDKLPRFGPGRNDDGNFVLSEIELTWSAGTNLPDTSAKFSDARADFSQNDFSANQAIDGKVLSGRNGWAVG